MDDSKNLFKNEIVKNKTEIKSEIPKSIYRKKVALSPANAGKTPTKKCIEVLIAKGSSCHAKGSDLFTGGVEGPIKATGLYSTVRYKFNDAAQLPLTFIHPLVQSLVMLSF